MKSDKYGEKKIPLQKLERHKMSWYRREVCQYFQKHCASIVLLCPIFKLNDQST